MPFHKFIAIPLFIAFQAFILMARAPSLTTREASSAAAWGALLLRGGPDRVWSAAVSGRAGDRLSGGRAGIGAAAAG